MHPIHPALPRLTAVEVVPPRARACEAAGAAQREQAQRMGAVIARQQSRIAALERSVAQLAAPHAEGDAPDTGAAAARRGSAGGRGKGLTRVQALVGEAAARLPADDALLALLKSPATAAQVHRHWSPPEPPAPAATAAAAAAAAPPVEPVIALDVSALFTARAQQPGKGQRRPSRAGPATAVGTQTEAEAQAETEAQAEAARLAARLAEVTEELAAARAAVDRVWDDVAAHERRTEDARAAQDRELRRLRLLMRFSELKKDSDLLPAAYEHLDRAVAEREAALRRADAAAAECAQLRRCLGAIDAYAAALAAGDVPQRDAPDIARYLRALCGSAAPSSSQPAPTSAPATEPLRDRTNRPPPLAPSVCEHPGAASTAANAPPRYRASRPGSAQPQQRHQTLSAAAAAAAASRRPSAGLSRTPSAFGSFSQPRKRSNSMFL